MAAEAGASSRNSEDTFGEWGHSPCGVALVRGAWHRKERIEAQVVLGLDMRDRLRRALQFVVCVENTGYPVSLELHKIYRVVPDPDAAQDNDIRVVDESGEDYLYPASLFAPITVPAAVKRSLRRAKAAAPNSR